MSTGSSLGLGVGIFSDRGVQVLRGWAAILSRISELLLSRCIWVEACEVGVVLDEGVDGVARGLDFVGFEAVDRVGVFLETDRIKKSQLLINSSLCHNALNFLLGATTFFWATRFLPLAFGSRLGCRVVHFIHEIRAGVQVFVSLALFLGQFIGIFIKARVLCSIRARSVFYSNIDNIALIFNFNVILSSQMRIRLILQAPMIHFPALHLLLPH